MPLPPVESLLPHRGRHLVLARIVSLEGRSLVAEGAFSPEDVEGHFPGRPVVPGVTMIEGLAQALACLGRLSGQEGDAVLLGIERARFRGVATPPCTLTFAVEIVEEGFRRTTARGTVRWEGAVVCSATLHAALLMGEPPGGEPPPPSGEAG